MARRRRRRPALNRLIQGVLVVDKPQGVTSQDVCTEVKELLRLEKVGHAGTLDPFATGVLPLLINGATRASQLLTSGDKLYRGTVKLGVRTDTMDPTGTVVEERPVEATSLDEVKRVCAEFVGRIEQLPPMYSAVRVDGQRLYELARQNIEVERKPKEVVIHSLDILEFREDEIEIRVRCSVGTYIRTLADDIGTALGCGAHLSTLVREESGPFSIDDAAALETLRELVEEHKALPDDQRPKQPEPERLWWIDRLGTSLKNLAEALPDHQVVSLPESMRERVRSGQGIRARDLADIDAEFGAGQPLLLWGDHGAVALAKAGCRSDVARRMPPDTMVAELQRVLN